MDGHVTETNTRQKKWRGVAPLERRIHFINILGTELGTDAAADVLGEDQEIGILTGDRQRILVPAALNDSKDAITILPVIDYTHTAHYNSRKCSSIVGSRR